MRRALVLVLLGCSAFAQEAAPKPPSRAEVEGSIRRGVDFLKGYQNKDGSYGGPRNKTMTDSFANPETHRSWTAATTGLVMAALLEADQWSADQAIPGLVEKAAGALVRWDPVKRPADWDIDNVWGQIYGLFGLSKALGSPRFADEKLRARWTETAQAYVTALRRYQSPRGGYGYYADAEAGWRPEWATTFTTAAAVIAFSEARKVGVVVDSATFDRSVAAVRRGRLPDGAYTYDVMTIPHRRGLESINDPRGSLGRIQACGYARILGGDDVPVTERIGGLDLLFREHQWLDCAFRRPIPHEAWYANAAYFYLFAHYHAALMMDTIPAPDRARFIAPLQMGVLKAQEKDGGFWDFYISDHTKPYGTSFAVMTLLRTLDQTP